MDGGNAPYYWIVSVLILSAILVMLEFKRDKQWKNQN